MTNVRDIPYSVYTKACLLLNAKDDLLFRDFRLLGEKMGYGNAITCNLKQRTNPTDELLKMWGRTNHPAKAERLIELFKDKDLERMDAVEILRDWVQKKA